MRLRLFSARGQRKFSNCTLAACCALVNAHAASHARISHIVELVIDILRASCGIKTNCFGFSIVLAEREPRASYVSQGRILALLQLHASLV